MLEATDGSMCETARRLASLSKCTHDFNALLALACSWFVSASLGGFRVFSWRSVHGFVVAHGGALVKLEQLSWRAEAATVSANVQCAIISGRQLQQQDRRPIRARVACRVSALRSFQLSSQGVRQSRACSVRLVPGSQNHAERALLWARRRVWQRRGVRGGVKLACVHGRCCAAFAVAGLRAQARPASLTGRAWAGRRQAWDRASSHLFLSYPRGRLVGPD